MHRYPLSLIGIATGVACLAIGAVAYWLAHPANSLRAKLWASRNADFVCGVVILLSVAFAVSGCGGGSEPLDAAPVEASSHDGEAKKTIDLPACGGGITAPTCR